LYTVVIYVYHNCFKLNRTFILTVCREDISLLSPEPV